jgi:hypothetical protein
VNYYRQLAFELRCRRLDEASIVEAMEDVHELSIASGSAPSATFGEAETYAATFAKGRTTSRGRIVTYLGAALAIAQIFIQTGLESHFDHELLFGPLKALWLIGLAIIFGGIILGVAVDHALPRAFRTTERGPEAESMTPPRA